MTADQNQPKIEELLGPAEQRSLAYRLLHLAKGEVDCRNDDGSISSALAPICEIRNPDNINAIRKIADRVADHRRARITSAFFLIMAFGPSLPFIFDYKICDQPWSAWSSWLVPGFLLCFAAFEMLLADPIVSWRAHVNTKGYAMSEGYHYGWRHHSLAVFDPAFLVGFAAFWIAAVNVESELTQLLVSEPAASLDDMEERIPAWFQAAKTELALASLFSLSAFLIENVLQNLSLTRGNLQNAARDAAKAAESVSKARDELAAHAKGTEEQLQGVRDALKDSRTALNRSTQISKFLAAVDNARGLVDDAELIRKDSVRQSPADAKRLERLAAITDFAGRRFTGFGKVFTEFFGTLGVDLNGRLSVNTSESTELRETGNLHSALLVTILESAFHSQRLMYDSASAPGGRVEFVAPFKALASIVAKLIDTLLDQRDFDLKNQLVFHTVLPVAPRRFLEDAFWPEDPREPQPEEVSAESWGAFLTRLRRAKLLGGPAIRRHFLVVTDELIEKLREEYAIEAHRVWATKATVNNDLGQRWNPLAHDASRDLLRRTVLIDQLKESVVVQVAEPTDDKNKEDGHSFGRPWCRWRLRQVPSGATELRGGKAPGFWEIELGTKTVPPKLGPGESLVALADALQLYHYEKGANNNGLLVMEIGASEWEQHQPVAGGRLEALLEPRSGEYVLVDYFAAQFDTLNSKQWVFVIRSLYDAELDVVKVELILPNQGDRWTAEVARLKVLFEKPTTMAAFLAS